MALTRITQGVIKPNENYVVNNINSSGVTTSTNFKTGTSNLHNVGIEIAGINVLGADTPIGLGATIYNSGAAIFSGDVKVGGALTVGGVLSYEDVTNIDSVGVITARGDISIADKIVHTGDTNTAIRFPTADTITAETAGEERFRISSAGNVGIGTDNPNHKLHISATNPIIKFTDIDNNQSSMLRGASGNLYIDTHDANRDIIFRSDIGSATEVARITGDGKVGIGTNNPGVKLDVRGVVNIETDDNNALNIIDNGASYRPTINFKKNIGGTVSSLMQVRAEGEDGLDIKDGSNNTRIRIASAGNVGIGTDAGYGDAKLTVEGTAALTNNDTTLQIKDSVNDSAAGRGGNIGFSAYVNGTQRTFAAIGGLKSAAGTGSFNGDLALYTRVNGETNLSERLRITSAGNVAIGTNTSNNIFRIFYTDSTVWPFGSTVSGAPTYTPYSNEVWIQNHVKDTEGSFAGIMFRAGSDANGQKHGTARIAAVETGDYKADLVFGTRNTTFAERLRITSGGGLLIGTVTSRTTRLANNAFNPKIQLEDNTEAAFSMTRFINSAGPPRFVLQKARGTGASPVVVQDNDDIGQILFSGWDGDTFTNGAEIISEVDGTPGDDQMPGRLIFKTNVGGTTNTERLRINSSGQLELRKNQDGVTGRPTNRIVFKDTDSSVDANQPIGEISWYSSDAGMTNVNSWIRGINEHTNGNGALLFGVKAAGSSEIEAMRITSAGKLQIDQPNGGPQLSNNNKALHIENSNGYVSVGPQNTSYSHFYTDRARFYFNKKIILDEGIISAYNDHDLVLTTGSSPSATTTGLCVKNSTHYVGLGTNVPSTVLHITDIDNPAQGSDWAAISMGDPNQPLRKIEIGARRSTRGGDWDNVGIGFKVHPSNNHTDAPETKMVLDYDGYLGVGTSNPAALLHVSKSISTAYDPTADSAQRDGTATINIENNDGTTNSFAQLAFDTAGTNQAIARIVALRTGAASNDLAFVLEHSNTKAERLRIDSVGRLLVGTDTAMTTASNDHRDTIQAVDTAGAQLLLARNDTTTSVTNRLGEIAALTNDSGGNGYKVGASIRFEVSATHGSGGDHPTSILFKTCNDGSDTLEERIRVNHDGDLIMTSSQINKINNTSSLNLSGGDDSNVGGNITMYSANHGTSGLQNVIRFRNSASECMRINGDGDVSINRADNTSNLSVLHVSSHDVTTKYNNDNQSQYCVLIDSHHSGTEELTANRAKAGLRLDVEYSGTGVKDNTSGNRNSLYGIHCTSNATKDTYTNYGGYFFAESTADDQEEATTIMGVYGYGRNYSIGGSNRTSTIYGGYFLGYRGGDINAGHLYGVYARAHHTTNGSGKGGDMTGVYAECEFDEEDITNAYAFRGYMDRDAGTITNGYILYGSYGGDASFTNRWGVYINDCAKNRLAGELTVTGDLVVNGSSKQFRIPHPIVGLSTTKDLVHAAIEGPQIDLIYRGKVDLVNGTATVNLDTKSRMTEGTFVLLNRDVQCFTTNETGWTNVKGSVTGNQLTIIAQENTCTDTISWMVIGERQDDAVKQSTSTNDIGKLIMEPDKRDDDNDKYQPEHEKNEYNIDPNADPGAE